jgi:hypothetical protein
MPLGDNLLVYCSMSVSLYIIHISSKMLAEVTIEFDDNFERNAHQLQQSAQPRREARVRHPSYINGDGSTSKILDPTKKK